MSGFASKLSAASTKGWKDFQSLWNEPKTTLTTADTSPGEKSSLLGRGGYGSGDSPKSQLLGEDEDSWGDWADESDWSSKKQSKNTASDWSAGNEDDFEAWLNDDDKTGLSGKPKKKKEDGRSSGNPSKAASEKSSSKPKKKPSKGNDGWDDADWESSGFTATPAKQKEPLVGNLLDLGDDSSKTAATNDGWDNEVWAQEEDDDDWQTLDLGHDKRS